MKDPNTWMYIIAVIGFMITIILVSVTIAIFVYKISAKVNYVKIKIADLHLLEVKEAANRKLFFQQINNDISHFKENHNGMKELFKDLKKLTSDTHLALTANTAVIQSLLDIIKAKK